MSKMKPEVANRRIESFKKRFGKAHLYLAYHAAFPLSLTPDLLYRLWANFQRDIHDEVLGIPWIAVADLLLSSLCDEVGHELYEMDLTVRNVLLSQLKEDEKFGQQRIHELSDFLLDYVQQQLVSDDPDVRDLAQVQQWTALAYVQPRQASRQLALALSGAYQNDKDDLLRLASLVETLAEPLTECEEFQPLLIYARGMASFARGNQEDAKVYTKLLSKIVIEGWGDREHKRLAALPTLKPWHIPIGLIALGITLVSLEVIYPFFRPLYYSYEGNRLLDLRQPEAALEQFENLREIKPNSAEAWKGRGNALLSMGSDLRALDSYNKALSLQPNNLKTLNNKGTVLYNIGKYQEALDTSNKVLAIDPNNAEAWSGQGLAYMGLGRYEEASQSFEKLREIRPDDPKIWNYIGLATEQLQGPPAAKQYYEEALKSYDFLLKRKPQDPFAWTERGNILQKLNRPQDALTSYQKALEIDNNFYVALLGKGNTLDRMGKPQEALLAFNRASEIRPDDHQVWYNRGMLLTHHLQKYEEALQSFDKAIERRNDFSPAWQSKGLALLELKRYSDALAAFDKAKNLEPKNPYVWANRGSALELLGKPKEAHDSYQKAIELGFPREQLREELEKTNVKK